MRSRLVVLPPVPALMQRYRSAAPVFTPLRHAVGEALTWLTDGLADDAPLGLAHDVLDSPGAQRGLDHAPERSLAMELLGDSRPLLSLPAVDGVSTPNRVLALANGSACRTERAPGFLHERAEDFDRDLGTALRRGGLSGLDLELAVTLWCAGLRPLAEVLASRQWRLSEDWYDEAPTGVQYWVMGFECDS